MLGAMHRCYQLRVPGSALWLIAEGLVHCTQAGVSHILVHVVGTISGRSAVLKARAPAVKFSETFALRGVPEGTLQSSCQIKPGTYTVCRKGVIDFRFGLGDTVHQAAS